MPLVYIIDDHVRKLLFFTQELTQKNLDGGKNAIFFTRFYIDVILKAKRSKSCNFSVVMSITACIMHYVALLMHIGSVANPTSSVNYSFKNQSNSFSVQFSRSQKILKKKKKKEKDSKKQK